MPLDTADVGIDALAQHSGLRHRVKVSDATILFNTGMRLSWTFVMGKNEIE